LIYLTDSLDSLDLEIIDRMIKFNKHIIVFYFEKGNINRELVKLLQSQYNFVKKDRLK